VTDFSLALVGFFAVFAAPGAVGVFAAFAPAATLGRLRLLVGALSLTFGGLVAAALISDSVLDWLSVTGENFQLAAGIVMLPLALRLLLRGEQGMPSASSPFWRAWTLLFGPVPGVLMLSYAARFGTGTALCGAALALLVSGALLLAAPWLAARLGKTGCSMLGRFNGALIVAMAIELIVDGIQSV
jgi:small neutral amino acid transporter SnatA (MarC family)